MRPQIQQVPLQVIPSLFRLTLEGFHLLKLALQAVTLRLEVILLPLKPRHLVVLSLETPHLLLVALQRGPHFRVRVRVRVRVEGNS